MAKETRTRGAAAPAHSRTSPWVVAKRIFKRRGGTPPRQRPEDFEQVFLEIGRLACEEHYRASRSTINRWLSQSGKARLIALRAAAGRRSNIGETLRRPIRPCPPDFEVAYVKLGPSECERRYRAGYRTIARWRDESNLTADARREVG